MARVDPLLLVVAGGVAGELEDLGGEVLHDGGQIDGGACSHTLGVVTGAEKTVDSSNGELEPGTGRAGLGLGAGFASLSTSRHDALESRRVSLEHLFGEREMIWMTVPPKAPLFIPPPFTAFGSKPERIVSRLTNQIALEYPDVRGFGIVIPPHSKSDWSVPKRSALE